MKKDEAVQLLLDGKVDRAGVRHATFVDMPKHPPIIGQWLDLSDQDHHARMEDGNLYLDLWYMAYRFPNVPSEVIIDTTDIQTEYGKITMYKFRMSVEVEYISYEGKRIWIDKE
ncbi:hypothetical protein ACFVS2_25195 [Brevibacillus sp. NPDC058079]|uniref:hypothetical protein n=1 Tax=Brevibacillus sp. NPDC058079 TaxID=3346330 RepID=UPI0036EBDF36